MAKLKGASLEQAIPGQPAKDKQYETEGHLRTLGEAADIMSDPDKLQRVHKMAGRRHKAIMGMVAPLLKKPITSIDDLRKKANAKDNEPDEDDIGG